MNIENKQTNRKISYNVPWTWEICMSRDSTMTKCKSTKKFFWQWLHWSNFKMLVKPHFNIPRKDVIGIWQKRKISLKKIIIMNIENKQTCHSPLTIIIIIMNIENKQTKKFFWQWFHWSNFKMFVKPRFNIPRKDVIGIWQKRKILLRSFNKKNIYINKVSNKNKSIFHSLKKKQFSIPFSDNNKKQFFSFPIIIKKLFFL